MSQWNDPELTELFLKNTPLIDVRAPIEFEDGSIPGSVNLPIMNDEERAAVGTCYKTEGQAAAIKLGHELVSGTVKEDRIARWKQQIENHPDTQLFCFRGGLRSQISCQWLTEMGIPRSPIKGGYKRLRNFLLSWLDEAPLPKLIRIGGCTGSGKTHALQLTKNYIDLEGFANHRGSAFGPRGKQPSQITFENLIARDLLLKGNRAIIFEDESATIGKVVLPQRLFRLLRASPLVILEVSLEERIRNIFEDYVRNSSSVFFLEGLTRIEKKLGKTKSDYLRERIHFAFRSPMVIVHHEEWISILLKEYYDPMYQKDLRMNQERILFRGNKEEILAYLRTTD